MNRTIETLLTLTLVLSASVAGAQRPVAPQAYGTTSRTIETIPFSAFQMLSSSVNWTYDFVAGYGERVGSGPVTFATAPVQVESGLRVIGIEMEACDDTADAFLLVTLARCAQFGSCTGLTGYAVNSGEADMPGCTFFFRTPEDPHTIDNFDGAYHLVLSDTSPGGGVLRLRSVRLYLQRQVSPAPATATFDDVPTDHQFFQHIEALADSEITSGCGGGNFCPNAFLTRGQMAVFLAKALGLHWPD